MAFKITPTENSHDIMKIGIDARFLQGFRRGQGQYIYYLIKELLEIDAENEYVIFYNSLKTGEFAFDRNTRRLKQVWCNMPGTILRQTWSRFCFPPVEYSIGNVDIFHNSGNFCFTHYSPIPSRAKMVATFHGIADPSMLWKKYDRKKIEKIDAWLRKIADKASVIITVSEMAKKHLMHLINVPGERIRVIYCGVNEKFRLINDPGMISTLLSKFGLAGRRYLLYVGGYEPNKNLEALLDVFCALSKNAGMDGLHLALVGEIDNFYRAALIKKAEVLKIAQKVIFTDYISHDDLPFIYNGAEAFVLPTLIESFGIPVLEAMACGVPVITSKNTGVFEVVGDSVASFDPTDQKEMVDSIGAVLGNKSLCLSLRERALERVKGLSWEKTARQTLAVYEEVHKKRKR